MLDDLFSLIVDGLEIAVFPGVDVGSMGRLPSFLVQESPEIVQAYTAATDAIAANPDDVQAYFTRGVICQGRGWHQEALLDFGDVLRRDPNHARAWYLLSEVLVSLGEYDKAKTVRQQARELDPMLG